MEQLLIIIRAHDNLPVETKTQVTDGSLWFKLKDKLPNDLNLLI